MPQMSLGSASEPADTALPTVTDTSAEVVTVGLAPYAYNRNNVVPGPKDGGRSFGRFTSLMRMRRYLYAYKWQLVLMLSVALIGTACSVAIPVVTKHVIDGPIANHDPHGLWMLGLLAFALGALEAFLLGVRRFTQSTAVLGLESNIRNDLYYHLQQLPMAFHGRWQSGQLLSRATTDLALIRRFCGFGVVFLITSIAQVTAVTVLLFRMYWPLGAVVLVSCLPLIWLTLKFETTFRRISRSLQDQLGDLATTIEEGAVGIRVVKAFGRRRYMEERYRKGAELIQTSSLAKIRVSARFWTLLEFIPNITLVLVLLIGAYAAGSGKITIGTLVAFMTLMLQLVWPIASLGRIMAMAQEAGASADRVLEAFDTLPEVVGGDKELHGVQGLLRFEDVSFRYPDSDRDVLSHVNLQVNPGETIAIVGATGTGKTLLTSLVPRLYDVTGGRITVDGLDIRELTLPALRTIVATAFEDPTLFSMSVRENLTLGRVGATDAEIDEALRVAQATFAYELPWGLDTRVGEQGLSLSGGQRQRLALARAVIAQPKILVLDDTLSALDVETEALVEEALGLVLDQATGIVVAHRASTVLLADRVALLQNGTITNVGTHSELLATVPAYRELLSADADSTDPSRIADADHNRKRHLQEARA
jgi:ATP-binding cassette, subfamily B, bacterial